jgi:hypothetical protein
LNFGQRLLLLISSYKEKEKLLIIKIYRMKKLIVLVSLLMTCLLFSAWSYDFMTEKNELKPQLRKELDLQTFKRVSLCCGIKLHLLTEEDNVFYAEGSEDDLDNLKIQYKNDKLSIYREKDGWRGWNLFKGDGPIDVYLSAKGMKAIAASSGSKVVMTGAFKTSSLEIDFSSGAQGRFDLNTDRLRVECSSGSEVEISGISLDVEIDVSSGSECEARNLSVYKSVNIEASSGATVELTCHGSVKGDVSSGAEIEIYGYPNAVDKEESSGGYLKLVDRK